MSHIHLAGNLTCLPHKINITVIEERLNINGILKGINIATKEVSLRTNTFHSAIS